MSDKIRNYPYEVQERASIYQYEGGMTEQEADEKAIQDYRIKQGGADAVRAVWEQMGKQEKPNDA